MNQALQERLNQIPDKILSPEFLAGQGLGNEIGFWIFDYPAEAELQVRDYLVFLQDLLAKKHAELGVVHINLLACLKEYLDDRSFTDKAIALQQTKGDKALLKALHGPLHMDKFAPWLMNHTQAAEQQVVLMSGVGSVWPVLRAHSLLNKLHALLGHKPLVLFYPGQYSGQTLTLFNQIPSKAYYRAFKLVP